MNPDIEEIDYIRYRGGFRDSLNWKLIIVKGSDREKFLQGQLTNDLNKLNYQQAHLTSRINVKGKIQSFFFLKKEQDHCLILAPQVLIEKIKADLEKYIIMDDVELSYLDDSPALCMGVLSAKLEQNNNFNSSQSMEINFYQVPSLVIWGEKNRHELLMLMGNETFEISDENFERLRILNGFPEWGDDIGDNSSLSDSFLESMTVDYNKGCFLGQEVLAKIQHHRGPAYFPVLLLPEHSFPLESPKDFALLLNQSFEIEDGKGGTLTHITYHGKQVILRAKLFRNFRIEGKTFTLNFNQAKINFRVKMRSLPYFKGSSRIELAAELLDQAYYFFTHLNRPEDSISFLNSAILLRPNFADAYEALGVILGKSEKFEEAINIFKKLLEFEPSSIMAHTNLSLYYMKMGKIEEAEIEKALATNRSFELYANESHAKKLKLENEKILAEELAKSEKLFLQVLEIDPEDPLANYGMGDLFLKKYSYAEAILHLEKVILNDPKYISAYLTLGKSYEGIGYIEKAKQIYVKGIEVAASLGQLPSANEMQSRLNKIL